MAETEGFEPSIPFSRYAHLANECLQPLGHVSVSADMPDTPVSRKRSSPKLVSIRRAVDGPAKPISESKPNDLGRALPLNERC